MSSDPPLRGSDFYDISVVTDPRVPEGSVVMVHNGKVVMTARTWDKLRPVPFWTRRMMGVHEAERDRRKYR